MDRPAAQSTIAQQKLVGYSLLGPNAEAFFNGARRQLDYLLDAVKKFGRFALIGEALVSLARHEVRGIPLGQKDQIGIERSALSVNADHPPLIPNQALGRGGTEQGHALTLSNLGQMMIVDRPQNG